MKWTGRDKCWMQKRLLFVRLVWKYYQYRWIWWTKKLRISCTNEEIVVNFREDISGIIFGSITLQRAKGMMSIEKEVWNGCASTMFLTTEELARGSGSGGGLERIMKGIFYRATIKAQPWTNETRSAVEILGRQKTKTLHRGERDMKRYKA